MKENYLTYIKEKAHEFFSLVDKRDTDQIIYDNINEGISFKGANLWVLIFAILIASLGLNVNSTAVIIGAMLISPLMGPIIGMGLAVGINDFELLKRSLNNFLVATLISVTTATLYFVLSPYTGSQSELLARTSPTLYDVLIALCGGAAGIVAISTGGKGNIIPGVAIATALMPPLCTAGFGLANLNFSYFFGAFYLYFINCVFIAVATYLGVRMMRFKHKVFIEHKSYQRVRKYIIGIVMITLIPAAFMTIRIVKNSFFENNIKNFISKEFNLVGTQIISHNVDKENKNIEIVAVGKEISNSHISAANSKLDKYNLSNYNLQVIQGHQSDSLLLINNQLNSLLSTAKDYNNTIQAQSLKIKELEQQLQESNKYDLLSSEMLKEIEVFFPDIKSIALDEVKVKSIEEIEKSIVIVMVHTKNNKDFPKDQVELFRKWIISRIGEQEIELVFR